MRNTVRICNSDVPAGDIRSASTTHASLTADGDRTATPPRRVWCLNGNSRGHENVMRQPTPRGILPPVRNSAMPCRAIGLCPSTQGHSSAGKAELDLESVPPDAYRPAAAGAHFRYETSSSGRDVPVTSWEMALRNMLILSKPAVLTSRTLSLSLTVSKSPRRTL
jgi:hypothetical protein